MNGGDRITPAAMMVTASVCIVLVLVGAAVCWEFVENGRIDGDGVALLLGIIAAANGLLARTWRETPVDLDKPVEVVTPPNEPLAVREAENGPVAPHRLGGIAS